MFCKIFMLLYSALCEKSSVVNTFTMIYKALDNTHSYLLHRHGSDRLRVICEMQIAKLRKGN